MKINNKNLVFSIIFLVMFCLPLVSFITSIGRASEKILDRRLHTSDSILWTANGIIISNALNDQQKSRIASDGADGAIITWHDNRPGSNSYDIYAQKINASGMIQWNSNGVVICNAASSQVNPQIISDGSGGAIIIWGDSRTSAITGPDIYAQRINSDGNLLWAANGTLICNATSSQIYYKLIGDDLGGAIIVWQDDRNSVITGYDIYAQHIDDSGEVQWKANGTAICNATDYQTSAEIRSDDLGGAIITWDDNRNSGITGYDIYAQHIDYSGEVQWKANGTVVCNATADQRFPDLLSDGAGAAWITWEDNRYSGTTGTDIYAQYIDFTGVGQWKVNGTVICNASDLQKFPAITTNHIGEIIITWTDKRSTTNYDIYSQAIDGSGNVQWTNNGIVICNASGDQISFQQINDGFVGVIIAWYDNRPGTTINDIYAQIIFMSGNLLYPSNGIVICNAVGEQNGIGLVSVGEGKAIITWDDDRSSTTSWDIYAQKIGYPSSGGGGGGGNPIPGFDLVSIYVVSAISVIIVVKMHYRKKKLMLK